MPPFICLEVSRPDALPGPIDGFQYLWAFYVNGYDPDQHCQRCFKGQRVAEFCTPTATAGQRVVFDRLDRFPYLYICGVASGPVRERRRKNLHLPLQYADGQTVEVTTYNGYVFRAQNAQRLSIPELPTGWQGKPETHVRCRNFQFAVAYFGYPAPPRGGRRGPMDG